MHVFTRYIATYIVVPAAVVTAFALGTAANSHAHPAPNTSHGWQHGAEHLAHLPLGFPD